MTSPVHAPRPDRPARRARLRRTTRAVGVPCFLLLDVGMLLVARGSLHAVGVAGIGCGGGMLITLAALWLVEIFRGGIG